MKNYLSFGGGVNSVALYELMIQLGIEFEAVFVDHGGDWPETYEYMNYFIATGRPVTILRPDVNTVEGIRFSNIVDYYEHRKLVPSRKDRVCTSRFKIRALELYQQAPAIVHIGYAFDESHRAKITSSKGLEYRWLLIEHEITRQGCIDLITAAGLRIPRKSGCYMCPFQGTAEYRELRRKHPDLFCRVLRMEEAQNSRITKEGKPWKPYYLCSKPLGEVVSNEEERQTALPGMEDIEYPPCQCGL